MESYSPAEADKLALKSKNRTQKNMTAHGDEAQRVSVDLGDFTRGVCRSLLLQPECNTLHACFLFHDQVKPSPFTLYFARVPVHLQLCLTSELTYVHDVLLVCLITLCYWLPKFQLQRIRTLFAQFVPVWAEFLCQPLSQANGQLLGWLPIPDSADAG